MTLKVYPRRPATWVDNHSFQNDLGPKIPLPQKKRGYMTGQEGMGETGKEDGEEESMAKRG